ncbi:hypothetical protein DWU98_11190 [Dyella monticola]|uniref:Uncharacterized protein n=1 Tax=Dyella monticola TaxID=1927958 RepID=A0A370WY82_9GAMM|nr:hypothetical protein [Dyella monticola]RDS81108.1 hypothetical protein DWU98_11190 [Dyella monticola]
MPFDNSYPGIRSQLKPGFADLSDASIEAELVRQNLNPVALEGFLSDIGNFASSAGKEILKAAPAVLPVAGKIIGGAVGGPLGTQLGGTLGSLAGGALGSVAGGGAGGRAGSPAATQLLQTVLNPQTLQALASMVLGPLGKPNVAVGGTPVPVSAFTNLLGTLAGRAEAEYNSVLAASREAAGPAYMLDYAGEYKADPAVAENRAEVLFEMLQSSNSESLGAESSEASEYAEYQSEAEALEAEYDAIEQLEMEMDMAMSDSEEL